MIIFLSYASEERDIAEQTKLTLGASGDKVFLIVIEFLIGDEYHLRIRKAVEKVKRLYSSSAHRCNVCRSSDFNDFSGRNPFRFHDRKLTRFFK
jgi:hypothetical protein